MRNDPLPWISQPAENLLMQGYFKNQIRCLTLFIAVCLLTDSPILSDSKALWEEEIQ